MSCNVLNGSGTNGDKSLAFGGLTHRRPPSPDLYGRGRRGLKSNESSESSSGHGSEYSGEWKSQSRLAEAVGAGLG